MKTLQDYSIEEGINPTNIWCIRENHPALVVQDLKEKFKLNKNKTEYVRWVLLKRGVNKWLYARLLFIDLKHELKEIIKKSCKENLTNKEYKKLLEKVYARMQNIARMPRWIEFGHRAHKKMSNNRKEIIIKGKHT